MLPQNLWDVAAMEQEKRRVPDDWEELLAGLRGEIVQTPDGWEERLLSKSVADRLGINPATTKGYGKRAKIVMAKLGWSHKQSIRVSASHGSGYVRAAEPPMDACAPDLEWAPDTAIQGFEVPSGQTTH